MGLPMMMLGGAAWRNVGEPRAHGNLMFGMGNLNMYTWALVISAAFVVFGLSLSFYLMFDHLSGYNEPKEQKWLIGIILMVPVYTITSFLSLWKPTFAIYFSIMGNCYEAFALYSFGRYLIACLGGEESAVQRLAKQGAAEAHAPLLDKEESGPREVVHPIPMRWCMRPWKLGRPFYDTAKFGIVQYMIIKVSCSAAALILSMFDVYGEGDFDFTMGYPYITLVQNFSQMWALYCLVQFYYVTKHELHEINPLAKFLCFKAVVFVTWWQGVVIALLFATGLATKWLPYHASEEQADMLQTNLQDFIICIEMAIAAVAHIYVYPATPYRRSTKHNLNKIDSVASELEEDIEIAATSVKESIQDVVVGGSEHVVEDVKLTVAQAVEPVESGIANLNEAFQENVTKMNDKLQDNVSKLNENFQEKVQQWGGKQTKEVSKEGTYQVSRDDDDDDDDEIVQTEEHVLVERDAEEDDKTPEARHPRRSSGEPGAVKEEVSGTTTSRSANKERAGEETISFRQEKQRTDSEEKKETRSTTKETNDDGEVEKDADLSVSERFRLDGNGDVASKETTAHKVEKNADGDVVRQVVREEREELDENGEVVEKEVNEKGDDASVPSDGDENKDLSDLREAVRPK